MLSVSKSTTVDLICVWLIPASPLRVPVSCHPCLSESTTHMSLWVWSLLHQPCSCWAALCASAMLVAAQSLVPWLSWWAGFPRSLCRSWVAQVNHLSLGNMHTHTSNLQICLFVYSFRYSFKDANNLIWNTFQLFTVGFRKYSNLVWELLSCLVGTRCPYANAFLLACTYQNLTNSLFEFAYCMKCSLDHDEVKGFPYK